MKDLIKNRINSFENNKKSSSHNFYEDNDIDSDNENNMFSDEYIFSSAFNCNNLDKEIFENENENYQRKNCNQNFSKNNLYIILYWEN